jgi:hypothetical protein
MQRKLLYSASAIAGGKGSIQSWIVRPPGGERGREISTNFNQFQPISTNFNQNENKKTGLKRQTQSNPVKPSQTSQSESIPVHPSPQ